VRRIATLAGFLAGAAGGVACSLVAPIDGLTGGTLDAGGLVDAPPGFLDGSASDDGTVTPPVDSAGADAIGGDDGGSTDAGAGDVVVPPPDAPSTYCAALSPAPLFCADFDEGPLDASMVPTPFVQVTGAGGTLDRSGAESVSPPDGLRMVIAPNGPNNIDLAGYQLFVAKTGVAGTYTLAFDVRVDQVDKSNTSDVVLAEIQFVDSGNTVWDLQFEIGYDQPSGQLAVWLSENTNPGDGGPGQYMSHGFSTLMSIGAWTRVSMGLTLPNGAGGQGTGTLSFGGTLLGSTVVHVQTTSGTPMIVIGGSYASRSQSGWTVVYDDVTFDVH
jgi:hypothetical protein